MAAETDITEIDTHGYSHQCIKIYIYISAPVKEVHRDDMICIYMYIYIYIYDKIQR